MSHPTMASNKHFLQKARSMDPTAFSSALKQRQRSEKIDALARKREEENLRRKQRNLLRDLRSLEMREERGVGGGGLGEEYQVGGAGWGRRVFVK